MNIQESGIPLIGALALIALAIVFLGGRNLAMPTVASMPVTPGGSEDVVRMKSLLYPIAKEITDPSGFINADRVSIADQVGKNVVLVKFWTYSCINCQRSMPYAVAWYEKYKDKGLLVIGVHSPEFSFEKDSENVREASEKLGVNFPVVLDNNFGTWRAYQNSYWPRMYLIDIDGFIVYDHIGEGAYAETEMKIQELLRERNARLGLDLRIPTDTVTPEEAAGVNFGEIDSPEVYFGAMRNTLLANGVKSAYGLQDLKVPAAVEKNMLYLSGRWNINGEYAENMLPGAKITFRYDAKEVYMVASADSPVDLRVMLDGRPISASESGKDVTEKDGQGVVTVSDERLYRIVTGTTYGEHTLTLEAQSPGLKAFTFTFG